MTIAFLLVASIVSILVCMRYVSRQYGSGMRLANIIISSLLLVSCGSEAKVTPDPVCHSFVGLFEPAIFNPNFPCDDLLFAYKNVSCPALSTLWKTFGDDSTCFDRWVKSVSDRPHAIEMHFNWRVHYGREDENDLFRGIQEKELSPRLESRDRALLRKIDDRANELDLFFSEHANKNSKIYTSLTLEDALTDEAAAVIASRITRLGTTVRSPVRISSDSLGYLKEFHGHDARCDGDVSIVSEDGVAHTDAESRDFLSINSNCLMRFLWRPPHQGLDSSGRTVLSSSNPPRERTFSISDSATLNWLLLEDQ